MLLLPPKILYQTVIRNKSLFDTDLCEAMAVTMFGRINDVYDSDVTISRYDGLKSKAGQICRQ